MTAGDTSARGMRQPVRRALFLLAGLAVLGAFGWTVRGFERLIATGEVVLLELVPVDPRSLMQGDYMRLAFALEREPIRLETPRAVLVLGLDDRRIGHFRRVLDAGAPGANEVAFEVGRDSDGSARIEPHSFLFQEGQGDLYAQARYGIFRVDATGRHLLVGLADAEARPITPP
ncbi:GDYXXLXY domain-containing protein [Ancylobacter terrae]|uniref:GDYXXLXY domain-containing protein n=1 Tax=Ancylobacter sp. sgz301288 TaxID=3342077 RepID=UPI00385D0C6F